MGASMLAKMIVSLSKLLFTFVLFSHRQFAIFLLNAFISLMELHFVHNYHIQVEQYRLFCSYPFDFVLFSALLSVLWKQENEEIDNIQKTCNLDEMYSGSSQLHVV